ncbi:MULTISPECIES: S26 family signal peptidase [Kordiimonas]|jgi:conjugative transfer signal peptidase TraF|uniref:S26 family signal peptidase n=1 Tax=Kordiimonas TaxID=288021 RepID=UPI00257B98F3|nr:S26 family signal peptidase [Kordiimonas sp. UBA4487]
MMTAMSLSALAAAASEKLPVKLIYNASPSVPMGLYWTDDAPLKRGDFVLIEVPPSARNLTKVRGYLPPGVPLLKRVRALEGDQVCRLGETVLIGGQAVAIALKADHQGRALPVWQGCFTLGKSEIFVLADHAASFDSRYFGRIGTGLVIARAVPLTLWPGKEQP